MNRRRTRKLYVHRAGRTGRAGAAGVAITIVAGMEQFKLREISRAYNINLVEKPVPTDEDIEGIVAQRVVASLEMSLRSRDSLENERMQRFIPLGRSLGEAEEDSPIIAMLLDDYYQRTLQAPPQAPTQTPIAEAVPEEVGTALPESRKRKRPRRKNGRRPGSEEKPVEKTGAAESDAS